MAKPALISALIVGAGLALVACQNAPEETAEREPFQGRPYSSIDRPISEVITSRGSGPIDATGSATLIDRQKLAAARKAERVEAELLDPQAQGELIQVKYSAREAAPEDVIRVLVSDFLGRSYALDPQVAKSNAGVTIDVDLEMTPEDIEDLLGALAVLHGWSIDDRGEFLVIGNAANMSRSATAPILRARAALGSEHTAARVFRLDYLAANEAAEAIKDLVSDGGKTVVAGRTLLVVDRINQLNRLDRVFAALDVAPFEGAEIWTYQLSFQQAQEAQRLLGAMATGSRINEGGEALITFLAQDQQNRIMVISRDPSLQPMVRGWLKQIDRPGDDPGRNRYLYRVQHQSPTELVRIARETFSERVERSKEDPLDPGIRFVAGQDEDFIIVVATPSDYADLLSLFGAIDRPDQQVMLQTVLAEVTLSNGLQWGIDYFLQTEIDGSLLELAGDLTQLGPLNPTGSAFFLGGDGFALLEVLEEETDVRLLTTPSIFVRDKEAAFIQIGGEVPIITSNIDSDFQQDGDTGIRQEIEYRETGVILNVQPEVNESGEVTLLITQEIRQVTPTTSSGIDSPEFTVRRVETSVTVPHGKTLLLGGIVTEADQEQINKIPLLGDIPLLGLAFQNLDISTARTELMLTITPQIVNDPHDAGVFLSAFLDSSVNLGETMQEFNENIMISIYDDEDVLDGTPPRMYDVPMEFDSDEDADDEMRQGRDRNPGESLLGLSRLAARQADADAESAAAVSEFLEGLVALASRTDQD